MGSTSCSRRETVSSCSRQVRWISALMPRRTTAQPMQPAESTTAAPELLACCQNDAAPYARMHATSLHNQTSLQRNGHSEAIQHIEDVGYSNARQCCQNDVKWKAGKHARPHPFSITINHTDIGALQKFEFQSPCEHVSWMHDNTSCTAELCETSPGTYAMDTPEQAVFPK